MRSGVIAQLGLLTLADAIRRVSSASRGCSFQARRILHRATDARSTDAATVALDPLAASVALFMRPAPRSEEHTSELQSLMRISYAVFCLKKKKTNHTSTS